jgi:autoinducer 2-degrading protein
MSKVALVPTFEIKPGKMDEFMKIILEQAKNSLEKEPGCLHFDVLRRPEDPDKVLLYEIYTDEAAVKAHREYPHYIEFRKAIGDMIAGSVVELWTLENG